jgi:hypothetical protein
MGTTEPMARQIATRLAGARLHTADGRTFELALEELHEIKQRAGWLRFVLNLRDVTRRLARTPLMVGIISGGGRRVMPWIEGSINPSVELATGERFDAREAGLEAQLIDLLGSVIPAGGHLMVEYESPGQIETHRELLLQVPPAATYLGALMFRAGFRGHFKDWYVSEGGHEGPRKLQANKSPNAKARSEALHANLIELSEFLERRAPQDPEDAALIVRAQQRALELVNEFVQEDLSP